jgi:hypothetical protein
MRSVIVAFAAIVLVGQVAQGQAVDEARAIIEKAIKAHQIKDKEGKTTAYQGKNKGTLFVMGLDIEFTQEVAVQYPNKFKETMQLEVMGNKVHVVTVYNGKQGWIKANDNEIKVEKEVLEEFENVAYAMTLGNLTGLRDKAFKLSVIGEVQVNGKPAIGITVAKEGKRDVTMYFDKKSNLMTKIERRTRDIQSGQEVNEERLILEYQTVAGRQMPKRIQVNRDGKKMMDAEVVESQLVERLDDSVFAQP